MTIEVVIDFLKWCSIINFGLLLYWFLIFTLAHDFIYKLHSRWFSMSIEKFDSIHYMGIAFFKIIIIVFNIVPYLALLIIK